MESSEDKLRRALSTNPTIYYGDYPAAEEDNLRRAASELGYVFSCKRIDDDFVAVLCKLERDQ